MSTLGHAESEGPARAPVLGARLAYREFSPEPALADHIEYLWTLEATDPLPAPILQGSASKSGLDLIIPLDGNFCAHAEHHLFGAAGRGAYLVGPLSQPKTITTMGRCTAVGARFRPGRAGAFFGLPMHELTDHVVALDELGGPLGRRMFALASETQETGAILPVQRGLQQLLSQRHRASDAAMVRVMRMIHDTHGNVTVAALAQAVCSSPRQLERRFREAVGIAPKLACRIARVRHAMNYLPLRPGTTWADVAQACGYYDQAHLVREFRTVAGVTPGAFNRGCGGSIALGADGMSCSYNTAGSAAASMHCHGTHFR